MPDNVIVRLVPLPVVVKGVTIPSDDGYYNIYINCSYSVEMQNEILQHELRHVANEELQSFYIIKSLLGSDVNLNRITYKDTVSYFSVLLDKKVTRWICRIYLKENIKYVIILFK